MNNCIYRGTISELNNALLDSTFIRSLRNNFKFIYGKYPSPSEENSWLVSLPQIIDVLQIADIGEYPILLEYRLPFDDERCDVLLLGFENNKTHIMVIELKQWSNISMISGNSEAINVHGLGYQPHPSYQVSNYVGKIRNFHSLSSDLVVNGISFLHNMNTVDGSNNVLNDPRFNALTKVSPYFLKDQITDLVNYLKNNIGKKTPTEFQVEKFQSGTYEQSKQFFDGIVEHAEDIAHQVNEKITGSGWGLSRAQIELKSDVINSLEEKSSLLFLVYGEPGAGKTLLAIHILLAVLPKNRQAVMGLVNNRLMAALRNCLNRSFPGASGALKHFSPRFGVGLASAPDDQKFDLVIIDEGQRMAIREMKPIMSRAPIVVIFYDDYQRLLPIEQGTKVEFLKCALDLGLRVEEYSLSSNYRCKGGIEYQQWIENLLSKPQNTNKLLETGWSRRYKFKVFSSIHDMIDDLREVQKVTQKDVCLLASFTETDGRNGNVIRVEDPEIIWAMKGQDYINFWINRGSNKLDSCASIFGCQGFERSYAGVIWGKDYSLRSGKWVINPNHTITDYIGRPSLLDLVRRGKQSEAIPLLFNRYRVLLTRGIDGTYVFCEDNETCEFLQSVANDY
jgi:uncharacterized protein